MIPNSRDRSAGAPASRLRFEVRGFGEAAPACMEFANSAEIAAAHAICTEELALIDAAIRREKIPFPATIARERPRFTPSLRLVAAPPGSPAPAAPAPITHLPAESVWARLPFVRDVVAHAARSRFTPLADTILATAATGRIVVAGDRADLVALLLRRRGRDAVGVQAGYGRKSHPIVEGLLQRPRKRSFIQFLLAGEAALHDMSAVVFIGDDDFATERSALADAGLPIPHVIKARLDSAGNAIVGDVSPAERGIGAAENAKLPKISVVTVSFNQAAYLEASIRSVLDQGYPDLDYIVIDGGSTDGSADIIARYRDRCAKVVIEPDEGQSDALNKGFALAGGDVLTWLCSDDMLEPRSLWHVAEAYRRHRADLIVGGCMRIGERRSDELHRHHSALLMGQTIRLDPLALLRFMRSWQKAHYFYQPEVFFSRRIWQESGAYLKRYLHYGMDYELWLRMALAGASVHHIPAMIACSRVHGQQKTRDDHAWYHQFRQILDEYRELFAAMEAAVAPGGDC